MVDCKTVSFFALNIRGERQAKARGDARSSPGRARSRGSRSIIQRKGRNCFTV